MMGLLSFSVILGSSIVFSDHTKAMTPAQNKLDPIDVSATFDLSKDGVQDEIFYNEDGEVEGTIKIEKLDDVNSYGDPILIPEGHSTYKILYDSNSEMIETMEFTMAIFQTGTVTMIDGIYDPYGETKAPYEIVNAKFDILRQLSDPKLPAVANLGFLVFGNGMSGSAELEARAKYGTLTTHFTFYQLD